MSNLTWKREEFVWWNTRTQTEFLAHSIIGAGKYLPRDFLLWNGETIDSAAWVVNLPGFHMVLVLFLCSTDGLARRLICWETCRIQCVCETQSVNMKINRENLGTQGWCIFCCKVLRFQRVYNPLQSSGWLDNLQRHHMRQSWACTDQTDISDRHVWMWDRLKTWIGRTVSSFFISADRHGGPPAPPAEPVFSSSLRDSSRLPSPADQLCWQASGEKRTGFKSSCRVTLGNMFGKGRLSSVARLHLASLCADFEGNTFNGCSTHSIVFSDFVKSIHLSSV